MQNQIIGDFLYDECYTDKIKRKEGNIYSGLIDTILSTTGDGIKNIVKGLPKFNIKRIDIEEIDKNLTRATEVVIYKLYQTDCGEYSLRNLLENGYNSTVLDPIAANNIAYAVMTSVSKYMLASLLYYYNEDFIFFYIRDFIVEKNFRIHLEKVREIYNKPLAEDLVIRNAKEIKKYYNLLTTSILTDAKPDMYRFGEYIENIKKLLATDIKLGQLKSIIDMDVKYPIPKFLCDILTNNIEDADKNRIDMSNFLTKLSTTFTKEGLRALFKIYGDTEIFDSSFDLKLEALYKDRLSNNGLTSPIDRLNLNENLLLQKIMIFGKLTEEEIIESNQNEILKNIKMCLSKYLSVGTKCTIDNDKLTVVSNGKATEYNYLSENIVKDALSPFNIFGEKRDTMEAIYVSEPDKFCANQTIVTRKESSSAIISGKKDIFNNSTEVRIHRKRTLNRLKQKYKGDKALMMEVDNLMSGGFDKIRYVNSAWFKPVIMEDSKRSLRVIAEMEGILNKIGNYRSSIDKKQ